MLSKRGLILVGGLLLALASVSLAQAKDNGRVIEAPPPAETTPSPAASDAASPNVPAGTAAADPAVAQEATDEQDKRHKKHPQRRADAKRGPLAKRKHATAPADAAPAGEDAPAADPEPPQTAASPDPSVPQNMAADAEPTDQRALVKLDRKSKRAKEQAKRGETKREAFTAKVSEPPAETAAATQTPAQPDAAAAAPSAEAPPSEAADQAPAKLDRHGKRLKEAKRGASKSGPLTAKGAAPQDAAAQDATAKDGAAKPDAAGTTVQPQSPPATEAAADVPWPQPLNPDDEPPPGQHRHSLADDDRARSAQMHDLVVKHAAANGVPFGLADAVIRIESRYQAHIMHAGNYGLMQLRAATARGMGFSGSVSALLDPETNLRFGMKYLGVAYKLAGGDTCRTLMRYQSGLGTTHFSAANRAYCARARSMMAGL